MQRNGLSNLAIPLALYVAACSAGGRGSTINPPSPPPVPRYSYTTADVHFMSSMIVHHAQAIVMSRMAPDHGASASVQRLAARIINSQADEIASMRQWLRDKGQSVSADSTGGSAMAMPGMDHDMLMPGMLSAAQLKELDDATGLAFDRLFLKFMIQHHRGAISMVETLFSTQGAAQDEAVFKFASDVNVDQLTEINRMERMLASLAAVALMTSTASSQSQTASGSMAPTPDPRVGLRGGMWDAAEASWNLRLLSTTRPSEKFIGGINSDLAFIGRYAIQGSFNGYQVWDISNPAKPALKTAYFCPASQSDVSVYRNLLFVSGESLTGRLDCGGQGVPDTVSAQRLRGIRIFDITDIANPRYIANVQTCRGSHTHSVLVDPKDSSNLYVYISGSARVRSPSELAGCSEAIPDQDPNSALFRIEVIKVPLAHPERAAIVSSPRIFSGLVAPPKHADTRQDTLEKEKALAEARAAGGFIATVHGVEFVVDSATVTRLLENLVRSRNGTGLPTAADSAALRASISRILTLERGPELPATAGPTQCHDITVFPAVGLAGGACAGYGLLLDIHDPAHPRRIAAAADSNFSYWHSATFNNDASKILFSDEWGGGTQAKCRSTDPKEWGADAIFTVVNGQMQFRSYYKLPVVQTSEENCVAHNGSLIPIPGRDVMAQAWYQGGISVFDWTDAANPREIAYFDRGPIDSTKNILGGSWSVYWYNGVLVSSEIVRGLDIFELTPSASLSQDEIDAAKTVRFDYLNAQGQPKLVWPPTFVLAGAYLDQLARSNGLSEARIGAIRKSLKEAEAVSGVARKQKLVALATQLDAEAGMSGDAAKVRLLARGVRELSEAR